MKTTRRKWLSALAGIITGGFLTSKGKAGSDAKPDPPGPVYKVEPSAIVIRNMEAGNPASNSRKCVGNVYVCSEISGTTDNGGATWEVTYRFEKADTMLGQLQMLVDEANAAKQRRMEADKRVIAIKKKWAARKKQKSWPYYRD